MTEDEMLYQALSSPFGLVVRCDKQRLVRAKTTLTPSDPALLELTLVGPNPGGELFILRNDKARASGL